VLESGDEVVEVGEADCSDGVKDLSEVKLGLDDSGDEYVNDGGPVIDGVVG
jgi:hypothetical protein